MQYAAFLKGVNSEGSIRMSMAELQDAFEAAGFKNVKTIQSSGNVIFESDMDNGGAITRIIEAFLKKRWKKDITVFVRTIDELKRMAATQPFKGFTVTPSTQRYVTFLYDFSQGMKIPELPPTLRIARMKDDAVFTVIEETPEMSVADSFAPMGKALSPQITTRNWNVVEKLLLAAAN